MQLSECRWELELEEDGCYHVVDRTFDGSERVVAICPGAEFVGARVEATADGSLVIRKLPHDRIPALPTRAIMRIPDMIDLLGQAACGLDIGDAADDLLDDLNR